MADCTFCGEVKITLYTCPRCNLNYCSVQCYQSQKHSQCSEQFYKSCVEDELKCSASDDSNINGDKKAKVEMASALKRIQAKEESDLAIQNEILDSDDEEDINDRLDGVDLDDPNKIWEKLDESEKLEFQKLVETGEIDKYIPKYVPWWDQNFCGSQQLIDEVNGQSTATLKTETYIKNMEKQVPKVNFESIQEMPKLIGNQKPSQNIKYNILNVVYAYSYALKYFRGDYSQYYDPFAEMCFLLSGNLRDNQNFDSADLAIEAAASSVNQHSMISVSPEFTKSVKKDVLKIVKGPREKLVTNGPLNYQSLFLLASITDLGHVFKLCSKKSQNKKHLERSDSENTPTPKKSKLPELNIDDGLFDTERTVKLDLALVKKTSKKLDFYLSWVHSYYNEFNRN